MQDPRPIIGRVVSVQGTTPGPASGIAYTIACHDANVDGVYRLEGQKPIRRWPDTLDTVAWYVGSLVQGIVDANVVTWHTLELPDFADCPANDGGGQMIELLRTGGIPSRFVPVAGPTSGSAQAAGGPSAPTGGGGISVD